MRILLYLTALALLIAGVGLVIDPGRPVNAVALVEPIRLLKLSDEPPELSQRDSGLRIELVGSERLEMGDLTLPTTWTTFDADAMANCAQLAPTPIASMAHDLAGG